MLARIVPGNIPPTFGAASIVETTSGADTADLITYGNTFNVSVTVSIDPPSWTFGYLVVLRGGATSAADSYDASTVAYINSAGTTNRTVTITSRTKNHHYRLWVYATDAIGNRTIPIGSSGNVQLTTLRYYRQRYRGVGSFTFDTVPARCDVIVVSAGADRSASPTNYGAGGFGARINNLIPPTQTFFYDVRKVSAGTSYLRRDGAGNTANQIAGTNATENTNTAGSVTSNTGIFATLAYATTGNIFNSGARVNGDRLLAGPDNSIDPSDYGDGGSFGVYGTFDGEPAFEGVVQVTYYD